MNTNVNMELGNKQKGYWNISCVSAGTATASKDYNMIICEHIMPIFGHWLDIPTGKKQNIIFSEWHEFIEHISPSNLVESFDVIKQSELDLSITTQKKRSVERALGLYQVINYDMIRNYLLNRSDLIDIISEIPEQLLAYFFEDDILTLELFIDPEEPDARHIRIKVITKEELSDPFERLGEFEVNWFFKKIRPYDTNLIYDIGYR